jgi:hypothetical protein
VRPSLVHAAALSSLCALCACRAFDRDRYHALLDAVAQEGAAPDAAGSCLNGTAIDDAGCTLAVIPSPPATLQDQPGNGRTYTLALRRLEIGAGSFGNWSSMGFDLDRRCTTPTSALAAQSCRPLELVADGVDGRDNAFGSVVATGLLVTQVLDERDVNSGLELGRLALGLRVTEWGGGDDRRLAVEWLVLTEGRPPMGAMQLGWDGRDQWKIDPGLTFAMGTSTPAVRAEDAFAACGHFSARFAGRMPLPFWSRGRLRLLSVERPTIAGALSPETGGTTDLVGVWTRQNVIDSLPWFEYCPPPIGDRGTYQDRLESLTRSFDVRADLSDNSATACDAASLAMRFQWSPVTIDGVAAAPFPQQNTCNTDGGLPIDP